VSSSPFQSGLFEASGIPEFDSNYSRLERITLDAEAWVDFAPAWVKASDVLFEEVLKTRDWGQRTRRLFDQKVMEPRLTSPWNAASGEPLKPAILEEMRQSLSARYNVDFDSVGFNWYRDGRDSVAWHGDQIVKEIEQPIVVLVSLGEPRRFLLKPRSGGPTRTFSLGRGDLLVTGGRTQRTWLHSVPKVATAGPRISLAFRYGLHRNAYGPVVPKPG